MFLYTVVCGVSYVKVETCVLKNLIGKTILIFGKTKLGHLKLFLIYLSDLGLFELVQVKIAKFRNVHFLLPTI